MIRRLGVSVASLAVTLLVMAAAISPHRASAPGITGSAVMAPSVSDAVLRSPMVAISPLSAVYVIAERPSAASTVNVITGPIADTPAMRSLSSDRLRDNSSSTWRSHTCDGSSLCRAPTIGAKPIDLPDRRTKDARS
jgi:hypothetical protein